MTGERNLNGVDRYAREVTERLWPGSEVVIQPMGSRSTTKGTYTILTPDPDTPFAVVKFAIPPEYLAVDDPEQVHLHTVEEINREANTIENLKRDIKERASDLESQAARTPSIWVPQMYTRSEDAFAREWVSGKHILNTADLRLDEAMLYVSDVVTITEGLGYAGFKALAMNGKQPHVGDEGSIETTLFRHYSPYVEAPVLSPLEFQSVRDVSDPTFKGLQEEDLVQATWLVRLARGLLPEYDVQDE